MYHPDTTIIKVSKPCLKCPKFKDLVGKTWLSFCHPGDLKRSKEMLQKVLKTQTPALHTDRARVLPGKYELHRHLNVPNINPETGKIDTITGYCAVVTERRRGIERRVAI